MGKRKQLRENRAEESTESISVESQTTPSNGQDLSALGAMVDALARLRVEKKALEGREGALVSALKDSGLDRIEGTVAYANVVRYTQSATDWKAIAERVGYSAQLFAAHTHAQERVSVRTNAKLGEG